VAYPNIKRTVGGIQLVRGAAQKHAGEFRVDHCVLVTAIQIETRQAMRNADPKRIGMAGGFLIRAKDRIIGAAIREMRRDIWIIWNVDSPNHAQVLVVPAGNNVLQCGQSI
jgi:hypothetical protein